MNVLVIDIGGTHIKVASTDHPVPVKVVSGPTLTPAQMIEGVMKVIDGWAYDAITIGYPGPVAHDRPIADPHNLGKGWVGYTYQASFPKPLRFINDAAMQALGGYTGGKMLFLGIGTGLGSALIVDNVVVPLELAHLPYRKGLTYEEYVGLAGLEREGKKAWRKFVLDVVARLRAAFVADYVTLGGGNAKLMKNLPEGVILGANSNAIAGGIALWHQPAVSIPRPTPLEEVARGEAVGKGDSKVRAKAEPEEQIGRRRKAKAAKAKDKAKAKGRRGSKQGKQ